MMAVWFGFAIGISLAFFALVVFALLRTAAIVDAQDRGEVCQGCGRP